jgi:hypothetical protein
MLLPVKLWLAQNKKTAQKGGCAVFYPYDLISSFSSA